MDTDTKPQNVKQRRFAGSSAPLTETSPMTAC